MLVDFYVNGPDGDIVAKKDVELEHLNSLCDYLGIDLDLEQVDFDVADDSGVTIASATRAALFIESGKALGVGFDYVREQFLTKPTLNKYFVEYCR